MPEEFELKKPEMCIVGPDGDAHPLDSIPDYAIAAYYDLFWLLCINEIRAVDKRKIKRCLRRFVKAMKKYYKEKGEK